MADVSNEEVLNELKSLNKLLSEDIDREKSLESSNQDSKNQSAEQVAKQDKLNSDRFEKISQYIDSENAENAKEEVFRKDVLDSLSKVDGGSSQTETLKSIDTKLGVLIDSKEKTAQANKQAEDVQYFTNLTLIVFFIAFLPAYLGYVGLSKLFDSAMA